MECTMEMPYSSAFQSIITVLIHIWPTEKVYFYEDKKKLFWKSFHIVLGNLLYKGSLIFKIFIKLGNEESRKGLFFSQEPKAIPWFSTKGSVLTRFSLQGATVIGSHVVKALGRTGLNKLQRTDWGFRLQKRRCLIKELS